MNCSQNNRKQSSFPLTRVSSSVCGLFGVGFKHDKKAKISVQKEGSLKSEEIRLIIISELSIFSFISIC